jgi:hypothetical protein
MPSSDGLVDLAVGRRPRLPLRAAASAAGGQCSARRHLEEAPSVELIRHQRPLPETAAILPGPSFAYAALQVFPTRISPAHRECARAFVRKLFAKPSTDALQLVRRTE